MSLNSFLACWSLNGLSGNALRGSFQSIGVSLVGGVGGLKGFDVA